MKSSAPTAVALTLLMFLLVLMAAVFFLFQGRQGLINDLQNATNELRSAEKQQAEIELENAAAQSTRDVLEAIGTSMAAENVSLTEQMVTDDQSNLMRETREAQLAADLETANATIQSFESQAPLVTVVSPEVDRDLVTGEPVELVIVASDHAGVNSIDFNIGNDPQLLGGPVSDAGLTAIQRHIWTPSEEGSVDIRITVTNINGISSEHTINLNVIAVATSTPVPTLTLLPAATAEN